MHALHEDKAGREIIELAKAINAGTSGNHRSKSEWYKVIKSLAERQRQTDETPEQAFTRFVTASEDGKALFKAMRSAGGPDWDPPAPKLMVIKSDSAYAELRRIAERIQKDEPALTREQAFVKAYNSNPDLAQRAKSERSVA
ncbi:hypothetical protein [Bradyrhizobium guangdongense]|uniref:Uncharacterized protein n=1 Tax=Bradyrhizobium guangdongense TaxID=1325090 RepID=A0A410V7D6_9BRAD|nr:hypothetical protein [Bradyrhizobium guangdongense]QAU39592.1 hypothetical protein X265_19435 [Bradyrhizobium guangdongense]QOZ60653.1 hypothetical protein XH86_19445 [Bradyrhizobium guangdongense]GGI24141.1 hypothetical protein GCM10010987_27900 [Bradyrhizobium guangdongense]